MLNTRELRVGNWVYDKTRRTSVIVDDISLDYINENFRPINIVDADPIPLTEQWLIDFGFEKDDFCGMYVAYEIHGIKIIQDTKKNTFLVDNVTGKKLFVDVVHQLQNLYFALTGQDLHL